MRRLGDLLLSLLILATGVGLVATFGGLMGDLISSATWESVPCRVGPLRVDHPRPDLSRRVVHGRFSYRFAGREYVSERLALDALEFHEPGYAEFFVSQQPEGERRCLVNPRDPGQAVLMRSRSGWETASWWGGIGFTGLILVVGVWSLLATVLDGARGAPRDPSG